MKGGTRMGRDTKNTKPYTQYLSFVLEKKKGKKDFPSLSSNLQHNSKKKNHMAINVFLQCTE